MIAAREPGRDRLISIAETCERTGLGRTKVSELLLRGAIKSLTIGRRRLVSSASLDRYIDDAFAAAAQALEQ